MRLSAWPLLGVFVLLAVGTARAQDAEGPPLVRMDHEELTKAIAQREADVTVVNFWATWCVPCREEFPYFLELGREFGDTVDVLFVSMDFDDQYDAARTFLREQGVREPSFFKKGKDDPFIRAFDEAWSGAIPATFIYAPGGRQIDFWEGKVTREALRRRVAAALADTDRSSPR